MGYPWITKEPRQKTADRPRPNTTQGDDPPDKDESGHVPVRVDVREKPSEEIPDTDEEDEEPTDVSDTSPAGDQDDDVPTDVPLSELEQQRLDAERRLARSVQQAKSALRARNLDDDASGEEVPVPTIVPPPMAPTGTIDTEAAATGAEDSTSSTAAADESPRDRSRRLSMEERERQVEGVRRTKEWRPQTARRTTSAGAIMQAEGADQNDGGGPGPAVEATAPASTSCV
jgi:hypothetical protein